MQLVRVGNFFRFLAALLLLTACEGSRHGNDRIGARIDNEVQASGLQATEQLRQRWNVGACQVLYEEAAVHFRSQSMPDWLSQCDHLRAKLGRWQSFLLQEASTCSEPAASTICLDGVAVFGKERYEAIIGWTVEGRQARLLFLTLGQNERSVETIPPAKQRLLDPPLLPTRTRRG